MTDAEKAIMADAIAELTKAQHKIIWMRRVIMMLIIVVLGVIILWIKGF